jgi:molybdopterin converting factor small subunit
MAKVRVLLFGDLGRLGDAEREVEVTGSARACDVALAAGIKEPAGILMVVNGKTAAPDTPISHGDEVAFFPRVGGGAA